MRTLLIFLFLITQSFAATIQWDHDCADTTGFYVYFSDEDNPQRVGSVDCPTVQAVVLHPGWYSVTAYNEYGESVQSNSIELAQYYYNAIKLEYNANGQVAYRGEHTTFNAATSDVNWVIKKYYYDAQGRMIDIKIRTTSWDNRAVGW